MNGMIAWFARNPVAANMLMLGIIGLAWLFISQTPKEILPNIDRDRVIISTSLPGASPNQAASSLCLPIERAISGVVDSINRTRSRASSGHCIVYADLEFGSNVSQAMSHIEDRLRLVNLPEEAGSPRVRQAQTEIMIARIGVVGLTDYKALRETAEQVRKDLIELGLSNTVLRDTLSYQIYIEISEKRLQQYQLSFAEVSSAISRNASSIAAGQLTGHEGDTSVVVSGQYESIDDIANTIIRSFPDGGQIRLKDLAVIKDGFSDSTMESRIDGKPAVSVSVYQDSRSDIMQISQTINEYIKNRKTPGDIELLLVQDNSSFFTDRMRILRDNAFTGLVLVFVTLLLFLRLRLAFWVSAGIAIAFLGGFIGLYLGGGTINMVSTFGLLLVLGIVVDDAIIIGENIHKHQQKTPGVEGAINGATELARPVIFAVATTAITFVPLMFLPAAEGRIAAQIPLIVIATLIFSLIECLLILPAHLAAAPQQKNQSILGFSFIEKLDELIEKRYRPLLQKTLRWRYACVSVFFSAFLICSALLLSDWMDVDFALSIEAEVATGRVIFPSGSDSAHTRAAVERMEQAALQLREELTARFDKPQIHFIRTHVGDNADRGYVYMNLATSSDREISGPEVMQMWRDKVGEIPQASSLDFISTFDGEGSSFRVRLNSRDSEALQKASNALKLHLQEYDGVFNISDSFLNANREVKVQLQDSAHELGLDLHSVSSQIRAAFVGTPLNALERDGQRVAVTLRLPEEERNSLWYLENLPIRLADGELVPLLAVADLQYESSPSSVHHVDGQRIANVYAQVDESVILRSQLSREVNENFLDNISERFPGVQSGTVGTDEAELELKERMWLGFGIAMIVIFVLMSSLFNSYFMPLLVLSAVPFGLIGALIGHLLLGHSLTYLSITGIIAVSGIVINDNMVLIFYINEKLKEGVKLMDAVASAGMARFRPILLTTITTFFGLMPIMLERSWEAQFLIPMAISISFGVLFATLISLFLVPSLYIIAHDFKKLPEKWLGGSSAADSQTI